MEIRKIRSDECRDVLALNENAVPHVNSIGPDELNWFREHASFVRTVNIEGRLAGFMIGLRPGADYQSPNYRWFCDHYVDFAYIDRIVVDAWARRRGVAEALYEAFAESETDAPVMTCEVNIRPANEGSMKFHLRQGFRVVASQEIDDGKKEVALMEKTL